MIKNNELEILSRWDKKQNQTFELFLTDHPGKETNTLQKLANSLQTHASALDFSDRVKSVPPAFKNPLPGFLLAPNILYSALPVDNELEPFLNGITCLGSQIPDPALAKELDKMTAPCSLLLFITAGCPHCPGMVNTIFPMAAYAKDIQLHIIDGSLFPETAKKNNVMSAPCLIINDDFRWTGTAQPLEIIDTILNEDASRLGTQALKKMLEDGQAAWIANKMIQAGKWFKGFLDLLVHETWGTRLAAMVVVEEIAETCPELGERLAPFCMEMTQKTTTTIQGDLLYLLGLVGKADEKDWITAQIKIMEDPELREAAREAVDEISSRITCKNQDKNIMNNSQAL